MTDPQTALLASIRAVGVQLGYRYETTEEGGDIVERVYRPDGSLAITARKRKPPSD